MARILHVDPGPVSRMHVARVLMEAGYEIFSTDDPAQDCPGVQFDLEIWSGADLLEATQRLPDPRRKVLLLSVGRRDRKYAAENGIAFLSRYLEGAILAQKVTQLLGKED